MAWHNLILSFTQEGKKSPTLKSIIYSMMPILTNYYASFWKGLEGSANTIKFPQGGLILGIFITNSALGIPAVIKQGLERL